MTREQMEKLKIGDRVRWRTVLTGPDEGILGTVSRLLAGGVVIDWEDGKIERGVTFANADCIEPARGRAARYTAEQLARPRTICPTCLEQLGESIPVPAGLACPGCGAIPRPKGDRP